MEEIIEYIEQTNLCLKSNLYFPALTSAYALIDSCSSLATVDHKATQDVFISWIEKNLRTYSGLNVQYDLVGETIYRNRCSLLHRNSYFNETIVKERRKRSVSKGIAKSEINKELLTEKYFDIIIFETGNNKVFSIKQGANFTIINLSIHLFINDILCSLKSWLEANKDNQTILDNLRKYYSTVNLQLLELEMGTQVDLSGLTVKPLRN